jgi:hypothetical protein
MSHSYHRKGWLVIYAPELYITNLNSTKLGVISEATGCLSSGPSWFLLALTIYLLMVGLRINAKETLSTKPRFITERYGFMRPQGPWSVPRCVHCMFLLGHFRASSYTPRTTQVVLSKRRETAEKIT